MKNIKTIIIILIIILLFILAYILMIKKDDNITVQEGNNTVNNTENRPIFNTNNTETKTNVDIPVIENLELKYVNAMEKNISNWSITKDKNYLIEAIKISSQADNEILYEPWLKFVKTNSSNELVNIVYTSVDRKKVAKDVYFILEWIIKGSGEYENFSAAKRQELMTNYQTLKTELDIK